MANKIVRILRDPEPGVPGARGYDGEWRLLDFRSCRGCPESRIDIGLRRKFSVGLAFATVYHGKAFHIPYDGIPGDPAACDGYLIWPHPADEMGPRLLEERRVDAEGFLGEYNAYLNGEAYGFEIVYWFPNAIGHQSETHWGYYDKEGMVSAIIHELAHGDVIVIEDEHNIFNAADVPDVITVADSVDDFVDEDADDAIESEPIPLELVPRPLRPKRYLDL